jgi:hypothetical protein
MSRLPIIPWLDVDSRLSLYFVEVCFVDCGSFDLFVIVICLFIFILVVIIQILCYLLWSFFFYASVVFLDLCTSF